MHNGSASSSLSLPPTPSALAPLTRDPFPAVPWKSRFPPCLLHQPGFIFFYLRMKQSSSLCKDVSPSPSSKPQQLKHKLPFNARPTVPCGPHRASHIPPALLQCLPLHHSAPGCSCPEVTQETHPSSTIPALSSPSSATAPLPPRQPPLPIPSPWSYLRLKAASQGFNIQVHVF